MTRKDDKGDQPSGGEMTWTNTGATRYGRGQHKTGSFGDDMLRPSPNHGTQRLPNDDAFVVGYVTAHADVTGMGNDESFGRYGCRTSKWKTRA